jgi:hypothetical protein
MRQVLLALAASACIPLHPLHAEDPRPRTPGAGSVSGLAPSRLGVGYHVNTYLLDRLAAN